MFGWLFQWPPKQHPMILSLFTHVLLTDLHWAGFSARADPPWSGSEKPKEHIFEASQASPELSREDKAEVK